MHPWASFIMMEQKPVKIQNQNSLGYIDFYGAMQPECQLWRELEGQKHNQFIPASPNDSSQQQTLGPLTADDTGMGDWNWRDLESGWGYANKVALHFVLFGRKIQWLKSCHPCISLSQFSFQFRSWWSEVLSRTYWALKLNTNKLFSLRAYKLCCLETRKPEQHGKSYILQDKSSINNKTPK